jgi:tetratricopeptide (TPR) repeat protein
MKIKYHSPWEPFNDPLWAEAERVYTEAVEHYRRGETKIALQKFQRAQVLAHDLGQIGAEAAAIRDIGVCHEALHETDKALKAYNESLELFRSVNDDVQAAGVLQNIALTYRRLRDWNSEAKNLDEVASIYRSSGRIFDEGTALNDAGAALNKMARPDEALERLERALSILRPLNKQQEVAEVLNNIGHSHLHRREFDQAIESLTEAVYIFQQLNNPTLLATATMNLARALNNKRVSEARETFHVMTPAIRYFRERQQLYPIPLGIDRATQLYSIAEKHLPTKITNLYASRKLVVGEVGDVTPNAFTNLLEDGNYVIEFNTGLMEFIYAVTRTLAGATNTFLPGGKVIKRVLPQEDVVSRIRSLFYDVASGEPGKGEFVYAPFFPLDPVQIRDAESIATQAELFILAHELGHVSFHSDPGPSPTGSEEQDADAFAIGIVLREGERTSMRLMYAGAMVAIRIFSGLERLGYKSSSNYPPFTIRLNTITMAAQAFCQDHQMYENMSTIAMAYDELMESVENSILPYGGATAQTPDRVAARLRVIVEEYGKITITRERALNQVISAVTDLPREVLRAVAKSIVEFYSTVEKGSQSSDKEVFQSFIGDLPEPAKGVFAQVFTNC